VINDVIEVSFIKQQYNVEVFVSAYRAVKGAKQPHEYFLGMGLTSK
jgi:hypothetical protein